ncbi:MAG: hypothetical protein AVDCRST_MAG85-518, partial [uncultured Solirubrobacteraceae bacterium]
DRPARGRARTPLPAHAMARRARPRLRPPVHRPRPRRVEAPQALPSRRRRSRRRGPD